jgi:hypothetical protein
MSDPTSLPPSAPVPPDVSAPSSAKVPPPPPPPPAQLAALAGPTINIGEEFGTAKRNLPPAKIVLIAIAAVLIVVAIASFVKRAKPQGAGSLDNIVGVEIPGQNSTMAALTFTVRNSSETVLYVRTLQARIKIATGESSADAVSAVDFDRYFQAFPALKSGAAQPLMPEEKIQPGEAVVRTVMVAFPVTVDAFNQRQSASVLIQPYNQTVPIVLTK